MGRILTITDQGQLFLKEARANGENQIGFQAPAALGADYTLTWPTALPGSTQFLRSTSGGVMDFATGGGVSDLQGAYNGGQSIAVNGANPIAISQANNIGMTTFNKSATGAGDAVAITNAGTGRGLLITQTGDGFAFRVDWNLATSQAACIIAGGAAVTQPGLRITMANGASNVADGIIIVMTGGGRGMYIQQNAAQIALEVVTDQATRCCHFQKTSNSADHCVHIEDAGAGNSVFVDKTAIDGLAGHWRSNRNVTMFQMEKTSAGAGTVLLINNAGTGKPIDTDAGPGTPAFLSNAGIWTNASCYRQFKIGLEEIDAEKTLSSIVKMPIMRYYAKADRSEKPRKTFSCFQDELVELFDLDPEGVSPQEIASIALVGIQALHKRLEALEKKAA